MNLFGKLKSLLSLIKFSHTVFALPFAISMLLIANKIKPAPWTSFVWIILAIVAARTSAMAFNRLIDRQIDSQNPRTANREIPAGVVSAQSATILTVCAALAFLIFAGLLGSHCLMLAPFVLIILLGYSLCKRFTQYSHLVLGIALSLAPGGVWYALVGTIEYAPLPMMLGVALWVAGFDIIYSCQDSDFDTRLGLFSVPSRFGVHKAFKIAFFLHLLAISMFLLSGLVFNLGSSYYYGLILFAGLLLSQYLSVGPNRLDNVNQVFFTRNGLASFIYLLSVSIDLILR